MQNATTNRIAQNGKFASPASHGSAESGQVMVSLLLMLAIFLLAMVGFAVDLTNLWFHRQAAQTAADAACQAGAMDMAALAAGLALPKMGFTPGTAADCTAGTGTICFYARVNGYNGSGIVANAPSNSVTWSFPTSVANVTTPPGTITSNPFLKVVVTENVKTYFLYTLHGTSYQKVAAFCTCGTTQAAEPAPIIVLDPIATKAFSESGGNFNIVGGPQRSLQVNSSDPNAIYVNSQGIIDTHLGGPNLTGADVGVLGGPVSQSSSSTGPFYGGTTGHWASGALPIIDPYKAVAAPSSVKLMAPVSGTNGRSVAKANGTVAGADGCPDPNGCTEYSPGYYPSGISVSGTSIFLPGIYYMNGSLNAAGGTTLRMATPCSPTCSPLSTTTGKQTDGLMFYFFSGSVGITGNSGVANSDLSVPVTSLTCDGSAPISSLGMPSTLSGNILVGQCAANGTYWDSGGDTSDSRGSPGSRGLLFFQDRNNTTPAALSGSGTLSFSGALYFPSVTLNIKGGSGTGTFILGQMVADQINVTGGGAINMALSSTPTTQMVKVGMLQ
ncbi:MAG: pilus assembly protein TadG-related protein [Acidobacteriota bacterium]